MQPNNYILQESHDGITFIDSKNWLTDAPIQYGTAAAQQHIYRYRELGITYYFRVKGTNGSANPIYSNIISKLSTDYAKGQHSINTGNGYGVGINGLNAFYAKDKIRHGKKLTIQGNFFWFSGQKVGNFIYYTNIVTLTGDVYKYDIINETLSLAFNWNNNQYHRYLNYHPATNSFYSIGHNGQMSKYDLTTNTKSNLVNYNVTNAYFHHLILGNKLYTTAQRFSNKFRIYDINTNTTSEVTIPTYNTSTSSDQYNVLTNGTDIYLPAFDSGSFSKYEISTGTMTTLTTGEPHLYVATFSADGSKIYAPYLDGTGVRVFDLATNTSSKINKVIHTGLQNVSISLLENGKYTIVTPTSQKGEVWDNGDTLTIDPMDLNTNQ